MARHNDNDSTACNDLQALITELNRTTGDGWTAAQKTAIMARLTAIQAGNGATTPAIPGPSKA